MTNEDAIRTRFLAVKDHLNERSRRIFAATEARTNPVGGVAAASRATGLARSTIGRGLKDLDNVKSLTGKVRRKGAGRPSLTEVDPTLLDELNKIVDPDIMGDPMRPLRWVSKSRAKLAATLLEAGHKVSELTVAKLLVKLGFRRQVNRKTKEGSTHPDRDAQFEHINNTVIEFQANDQPVISVDTKKKELIGDFKNAGSDYRRTGCPDEVRTHDFMDKDLGKAVPHGIYDITADEGWVTVGVDSDTSEFAVNSIRCWWLEMGKERYPTATSLMITADGGGSNGYRVRLWKRELQNFADETGISITVCHFPPGTSKWNKIEHRMFCQITQNWRGTPLTSRLAIVELIAATTTTQGLTIRCELDTRLYKTAIKVPDGEFNSLNIDTCEFHPEWNYTIRPRPAIDRRV